MRYLYFETVDKYVIETLPNGQTQEHHITGELRSDHPAVKQAWFTGGRGWDENDPKMYIRLNILLNNGERFLKENVSDEEARTLNIPEAIEFLKSIPINESL